MKSIDLVRDLIVKDEKGFYIRYQDFKKLDLNLEEKNMLISTFKHQGIEIRRKNALVEEFNYGEFINSFVPKIADIRYDKNGEITFEDYSELDKYLEEEFIPFNVNESMEIDEVGNRSVGNKYVHLSKLVKKNFCDAEFKYIMEYLKEKNIIVKGTNSFLSEEFDNYESRLSIGENRTPSISNIAQVLKDVIEYKNNPSDELLEKVVKDNMKIISLSAFAFSRISGVDVEELKSYGYEGLLLAIDRFDPEKSKDFYTYSTSYINGYIRIGICEIKGIERNFYSQFCKFKTEVEDEYCESIEDNYKLVDVILERMANEDYLKEDEIQKCKAKILLSMPESIEEYADSIEASDDNRLYYEFAYNELKRALDFNFNKLKSRRVDITKRRYGIGYEKQGRKEIAKEFGVSQSNIADIYGKVLKRLRKSKRLENAYDDFAQNNYYSDRIIAERNYSYVKKKNRSV